MDYWNNEQTILVDFKVWESAMVLSQGYIVHLNDEPGMLKNVLINAMCCVCCKNELTDYLKQ